MNLPSPFSRYGRPVCSGPNLTHTPLISFLAEVKHKTLVRLGDGPRFQREYSPGQSLIRIGAFPTLIKYIVRDIDNHMTYWKVIALVSGDIEAVSGPAAQDRPGAHEWIVWEGQAADKAEALQSAEKADPRVDLEWMRIRYERDLNKR